jgi:hypothetical protein
MRKKFKIIALTLISILTLVLSCNDDPAVPEEQTGKIQISFEHRVDGQPIVFDKLIYKNESGNQYLVNEIQYFISDVKLHKTDGSSVLLDAWEDIHYVDTDLPDTWQWNFLDEIPLGSFEKISFTFGINEEKNQSLMFVNPPESLMFWPELLGGGYHYMKLNGKWIDTLNQESPYNFHLGIGQVYYSYPDSITSYIQNYFEVVLPNSSFELSDGQTQKFTLVMNVENWFKSPNTYNHNQWGGDIMQKQDAMKTACENGWNVFTLEK